MTVRTHCPSARPRRPPHPLATSGVVAVVVALLPVLAWPATAHAAGSGAALLAVNSVNQTISNITRWIVGILAGTATMFLTIGGLRYLMAGGDPGEVEKAKGAIRNACKGYMLALMAPVIVGILKSLVGG